MPDDRDILGRAAALRQTNGRAAMITVIATAGSTPRKPGARMLVLADGSTVGTVGGGTVEHVLRDAAARVLHAETPEIIEHALTAELAMCCGGRMTFFVEPIVAQPTLIVLGCGHVGAAVIQSAGALGFDIVAVDDLLDNIRPERLPHAGRIVPSYEAEDLERLPFGPDTYVVIATRAHDLDQQLLERCLRQTSRYLGVIGSPRKARLQRERLAAKGFSPEAIARVHCPIGLDVGAQTPEEIAVSVCAELIQVRRGGARFAAR